MNEFLKRIDKWWLYSLLPLLSGGLSKWLSVRAIGADTLVIPTKSLSNLIAIGAAMVVLTGSLAVRYWLRDTKRAQVKFAKDMGRPICGCTPAGEIMIQQSVYGTRLAFECPRCKSVEKT